MPVVSSHGILRRLFGLLLFFQGDRITNVGPEPSRCHFALESNPSKKASNRGVNSSRKHFAHQDPPDENASRSRGESSNSISF